MSESRVLQCCVDVDGGFALRMHEPIFAKALWGKATADLRWQAVICNAPFDDATIVHQTVLPRSMPDDPWAVRVVFTTTVTPVTN